jgi:hypothetical protein
MIEFNPVDNIPPTRNMKGRWRVAVEKFAESTHAQVELEIGETPVRSAQSMTMHAIKSLGLWETIGVSSRDGALYLYRKEP